MENIYLFTEGQFRVSQIDLHDDDIEKGFEAAGYMKSQDVGNVNGLSYEIWEHGVEHKWIIVFGTSCAFCVIQCESWPDLIGLLQKLSVIVIAGAMENSTYGPAYFKVAGVPVSEQE